MKKVKIGLEILITIKSSSSVLENDKMLYLCFVSIMYVVDYDISIKMRVRVSGIFHAYCNVCLNIFLRTMESTLLAVTVLIFITREKTVAENSNFLGLQQYTFLQLC